MAIDNPPPVQTRKTSFSQLVRKADPRYDRDFSWSIEYEFSDQHYFYGNPQQRGAYDPNWASWNLGSNLENREDGNVELREDGSRELRE